MQHGAGSFVVDSTGLTLCGAGEWLVEKHSTARRRSWRKLHIGMDADTGQIIASALTTNGVDDVSQVSALLDQIDSSIASFVGDGAYDQEAVYTDVTVRHPEARVVVPPDWLRVSGAAGLASANDQAKTRECCRDAMIL